MNSSKHVTEAKQIQDKKKVQPSKIAQELSDITHLKAVSFKGFDKYKEMKPWEMCSFSEGKVNKFIAKHPEDYFQYNTRQLSRIYPKGSRFDSSNYDPVSSWLFGAQIVALNYQTGSEPRWINDGLFMENGCSGYLLKPKYMREEKMTVNPYIKIKPVKTLCITVISAFQLPKVGGKEAKQTGLVIDPYVKIKIRGAPVDETKSQKTKVIKNNGFNPVWNAEFKFPLQYPDFDILFFTINDNDLISSDDFIGQYAIPISAIREGYRTVPLKDSKGVVYEKATLFVNVRFT